MTFNNIGRSFQKIEDESNLYDIRSLLSKIPNSQEIIAQIKSGLKSCIYQSFILLCAKEIVGVSSKSEIFEKLHLIGFIQYFSSARVR